MQMQKKTKIYRLFLPALIVLMATYVLITVVSANHTPISVAEETMHNRYLELAGMGNDDDEDDNTGIVLTSSNAPSSDFEIDPSIGGRWSEVVDWPIMAIHTVLDKNGKVVSYGGTPNGKQGGHLVYDIWDPAMGTGPESHNTKPNRVETDLFCAAQAINPTNGQIITMGGSNRATGGGFVNADGLANDGNANITFYKSGTGNFINRGQTMAQARWYPTMVGLPDGSMLIQGGVLAGKTKELVTTPELFNPNTGEVIQLTGAESTTFFGKIENRWNYPRSFVAPNGKVFGITGTAMYYLDPTGNGSIESAGKFDGDNHGITSTSVMYQPGKILQVGGGWYKAGKNGFGGVAPDGSRNASIIDINSGNPIVTNTGSMAFQRHWADATVLPNGEVFVNGGSRITNEDTDVAYFPEIWNPDSGKWTIMNPEALPRLYHSTSLLLQDGRVLVAGGGAPGPVRNINAQIFSPPYLFDESGADRERPSIIKFKKRIDYETDFLVNVKNGNNISRVTLVHHGAVTHSFNSSQRFVELDFEQNGNVLNITSPDNTNIVPPGFYMLFVLDEYGTPSIAKTVKIRLP